MRIARARRQLIFLSAICMAAMACNLELDSPVELPDSPAVTMTAVPATVAEASATLTGAATQQAPTTEVTAEAPATQGPLPIITVSAVGGRLNVRRGPGPEYDPVGALLDGQSRTAIARNADSSWLHISGPNTSTGLGWVIITTKYTSVSGAADELPVETVGPAAPAYIRNCTPHEMLVNPTGIVLLDRSSTPENQLQFFPGEYSAIDQTTETVVANITVFEGRTLDIRKDASGSSYTCP